MSTIIGKPDTERPDAPSPGFKTHEYDCAPGFPGRAYGLTGAYNWTVADCGLIRRIRAMETAYTFFIRPTFKGVHDLRYD